MEKKFPTPYTNLTIQTQPKSSGVNQLQHSIFTSFLACTRTLFSFSFCSFGKHRRVRERGEREKEKINFLLLTPLPVKRK